MDRYIEEKQQRGEHYFSGPRDCYRPWIRKPKQK